MEEMREGWDRARLLSIDIALGKGQYFRKGGKGTRTYDLRMLWFGCFVKVKRADASTSSSVSCVMPRLILHLGVPSCSTSSSTVSLVGLTGCIA
jgi:hypothetical protein